LNLEWYCACPTLRSGIVHAVGWLCIYCDSAELTNVGLSMHLMKWALFLGCILAVK